MPLKAKTTKKKTTAKKSAAKKAGRTARKPGRPRGSAAKTGVKKKQQQLNINPIYALTIMGLLIIILLMVNKLYFSDKTGHGIKKKDIVTKQNENREVNTDKIDTDIIVSDKIKKDVKKENVNQKQFVKAKIFFIRFNKRTEKLFLSPVERKMSSDGVLMNSLRELVRGPVVSEKRRGYITAIPKRLRIRSVRMRNRVAEIDFNGEIEKGANGDILLKRIDQIVYTATQFEDVDRVRIKINGRARRTLGSDGLSINRPLGRKR
ncbi:GerMN domain-containing protein [Spirochaetota bacterium]